MKDYLTPKEISKMLGIGYRSVHRWIKKGEIKATKINGRFYISKSYFLRKFNHE